MEQVAIVEQGSRPRRGGITRDWLVAVLLAGFLSACWAWRDWSNLSALILPDADDLMRLAQVRDWLAGQATNDWTQYRLAPPAGGVMHWSRVADLGPAVLILTATPALGRHGAEILAVIAWPALLFATSLFLTARIARRLWGAEAATVAAVLGALAYPGITVFAPGRIDHHGLQVVLIAAAVLAAMRRPTSASGLVVGGMVALSHAIGLEAAAQLLALLGVLFAFWVVRGTLERARMLGVAAGLAAVTATFLLFLRPSYWPSQLCDAFTPASSFAVTTGGVALAVLAAARSGDWRMRLTAGALLAAGVLGATILLYPACLAGPYGAMDPFLRDAMIGQIDEAIGVFAHPPARAVQLGGLMLAGCVAVGWTAWTVPARWRLWAPVGAVVLVSGIVTLAQVRGTYLGTPLAAPMLAGLVIAARRLERWRLPALLGAWIASAGLAWHALPTLASTPAAPAMASEPSCNTPETWAVVDRYPPGIVMASTNHAAALIGATRMSAVGSTYHRNSDATLATYRFFLSAPETPTAIRADYVAFCPGDFGELAVARRYPGSVAALLTQDRAPAGFRRLPLRGSALRLYRIAR